MFYETVDRNNIYTVETDPSKHPFYGLLVESIKKWNLKDTKCLEIGSSKGLFQDLVDDYTGVDIAETLSRYHKEKLSQFMGLTALFRLLGLIAFNSAWVQVKGVDGSTFDRW
jgi:hypothetical protein